MSIKLFFLYKNYINYINVILLNKKKNINLSLSIKGISKISLK